MEILLDWKMVKLVGVGVNLGIRPKLCNTTNWAKKLCIFKLLFAIERIDIKKVVC